MEKEYHEGSGAPSREVLIDDIIELQETLDGIFHSVSKQLLYLC